MHYMMQKEVLQKFGNLQQDPLKGCGHMFCQLWLSAPSGTETPPEKRIRQKDLSLLSPVTEDSVSAIKQHTEKCKAEFAQGSSTALLGRYRDISAQEQVLSDFRWPLPRLLLSRDHAPVKPVAGYLYQGVHQRVQQGDDVMSEVTSLRL